MGLEVEVLWGLTRLERVADRPGYEFSKHELWSVTRAIFNIRAPTEREISRDAKISENLEAATTAQQYNSTTVQQ